MVGKTLQGPALFALNFLYQLCLLHWPCFSIPQILRAFCLRLRLCWSFCLNCHCPRSLCGLAAHLSGISSSASSSRSFHHHQPPDFLLALTFWHHLVYVIIYWLIPSCSKICLMRADTISIVFSSISPEPSLGSVTEGTLTYWLDKSVLTKGKNYWLRKKKKRGEMFQYGDLVYVDSVLKQLVKFNSMEKNGQNDIFTHYWLIPLSK